MDVSTPVHGPASGPVDFSALHDPGFDKVTASRQNADTLMSDARAFIEQVYADRPDEMQSRLEEVMKSISEWLHYRSNMSTLTVTQRTCEHSFLFDMG